MQLLAKPLQAHHCSWTRQFAPESLLVLLLATTALSASTCYHVDGTSFPAEPCDPTARVTHCCTGNDYCLSNGLCLDGGDDNLLTLQGCTDPEWGAPCLGAEHAAQMNPNNGYISAFLCTSLTGGGSYCLTPDAVTCCDNSSTPLIQIPLFESIHPAGQIQTSTTSTERTSPASTSRAPSDEEESTTGSASSSDETEDVSSVTSNVEGEEKKDSNTLAIALGIAIPTVVILGAAITFLGFQIRRRNRSVAAAEMPDRPMTGGTYGVYPSVASPGRTRSEVNRVGRMELESQGNSPGITSPSPGILTEERKTPGPVELAGEQPEK